MQTATWGANWLVGTNEFKRKRKKKRKTMLARFQAEQYFFLLATIKQCKKEKYFVKRFSINLCQSTRKREAHGRPFGKKSMK